MRKNSQQVWCEPRNVTKVEYKRARGNIMLIVRKSVIFFSIHKAIVMFWLVEQDLILTQTKGDCAEKKRWQETPELQVGLCVRPNRPHFETHQCQIED